MEELRSMHLVLRALVWRRAPLIFAHFSHLHLRDGLSQYNHLHQERESSDVNKAVEFLDHILGTDRFVMNVAVGFAQDDRGGVHADPSRWQREGLKISRGQHRDLQTANATRVFIMASKILYKTVMSPLGSEELSDPEALTLQKARQQATSYGRVEGLDLDQIRAGSYELLYRGAWSFILLDAARIARVDKASDPSGRNVGATVKTYLQLVRVEAQRQGLTDYAPHDLILRECWRVWLFACTSLALESLGPGSELDAFNRGYRDLAYEEASAILGGHPGMPPHAAGLSYEAFGALFRMLSICSAHGSLGLDPLAQHASIRTLYATACSIQQSEQGALRLTETFCLATLRNPTDADVSLCWSIIRRLRHPKNQNESRPMSRALKDACVSWLREHQGHQELLNQSHYTSQHHT